MAYAFAWGREVRVSLALPRPSGTAGPRKGFPKIAAMARYRRVPFPRLADFMDEAFSRPSKDILDCMS
jgi:hypothetical protein